MKSFFALLKRQFARLKGAIAPESRSQRPPTSPDSPSPLPLSLGDNEHTVVLSPEQAAAIFAQIAPEPGKPERPSRKTHSGDDETDPDLSAHALPRRKRALKKVAIPSLAPLFRPLRARIASIPIAWIGAGLGLLFPLAVVIASFGNHFLFRFLYMAAFLLFSALGVGMARFKLRPVLFFTLAIALFSLFIALSLIFYSPYDPQGLAFFSFSLDRLIHPLSLFFALFLITLLWGLPALSKTIKFGLSLLWIYPLLVWGVATLRDYGPGSLVLRLHPFDILPPPSFQPLSLSAIALVPIIVLVAVGIWGGNWKKTIPRHGIFSTLLGAASVEFFFLASLYAYGLSLPFGLGSALSPPLRETLSIAEGESNSPPLVLDMRKGRGTGKFPPLHVISGAISGEALRASRAYIDIPLSIRSFWNHPWPFLQRNELLLSREGRSISDFALIPVAPEKEARDLVIVVALDSPHADLLPALKLGLVQFGEMKRPRDRVAVYFLSSKTESLEATDLGRFKWGLLALNSDAAIFSAEGEKSVHALLQQLSEKQPHVLWVHSFTPSKSLSDKVAELGGASGTFNEIAPSSFQDGESLRRALVAQAASRFENYRLRISTEVFPKEPTQALDSRATSGEGEMGVRILYPSPGDSVSGHVPIHVGLSKLLPKDIQKLSFSVDGKAIGEVRYPPFLAYWESAGTEKRTATVSVSAATKDGKTFTSTTAVAVDGRHGIRFEIPKFGQYIGREVSLFLAALPGSGGDRAIDPIEFFADSAPLIVTPDPKNPLHFKWQPPVDWSGTHFIKAIAHFVDGMRASALVEVHLGMATLAVESQDKKRDAAIPFLAPEVIVGVDASQSDATPTLERFEDLKAGLSQSLVNFSEAGGSTAWSFWQSGGLRVLPHKGCEDYGFFYRGNALKVLRDILPLKPQGSSPTLSALRALFSKHPFKKPAQAVFLLQNADTCSNRNDHPWASLFSSEREKSKVLHSLSSAILIPAAATESERKFFDALANAIHARPVFYPETGPISPLIAEAMAYPLTIEDKSGVVVWQGPFKPGEIPLPMGAYRYRIGRAPLADEGEFELKNGERLTWTVKPSPLQNPPFAIEKNN